MTNNLKTTLQFTLNTRYELRFESSCNLVTPKQKSKLTNLTLKSPIWNNILEHIKSAIIVNTFIFFYTY